MIGRLNSFSVPFQILFNRTRWPMQRRVSLWGSKVCGQWPAAGKNPVKKLVKKPVSNLSGLPAGCLSSAFISRSEQWKSLFFNEFAICLAANEYVWTKKESCLWIEVQRRRVRESALDIVWNERRSVRYKRATLMGAINNRNLSF